MPSTTAGTQHLELKLLDDGTKELEEPRDGWDIDLLIRAMRAANFRANADALESRVLVLDQTTFQTSMDGVHLRLLVKQIHMSLLGNFQERAVENGQPSWIFSSLDTWDITTDTAEDTVDHLQLGTTRRTTRSHHMADLFVHLGDSASKGGLHEAFHVRAHTHGSEWKDVHEIDELHGGSTIKRREIGLFNVQEHQTHSPILELLVFLHNLLILFLQKSNQSFLLGFWDTDFKDEFARNGVMGSPTNPIIQHHLGVLEGSSIQHTSSDLQSIGTTFVDLNTLQSNK
jgi:hypothetical protein